jgi:SAM-dependent methyltransferase
MAWRRFGWHWNELGRSDPFAAIITRAADRGGSWDVEEFFAIGRADAERFMADLDRLRPSLRRGSALDFGCGVGRITRALSEHFESVVGIDIARSMIAHARVLNRSYPRCRFVVNRAPHLRQFPTGGFDVAYSRLVLQHLPPRVVTRYVRELIRVLAPGGALMFQLPTDAVNSETIFLEAPVLGEGLKRRLPKPFVTAYRWFKYRLVLGRIPRMDMFGVSRETVLDVIRSAGGEILEIRPDQSHGQGVPGFEYWVTKSSKARTPIPQPHRI